MVQSVCVSSAQELQLGDALQCHCHAERLPATFGTSPHWTSHRGAGRLRSVLLDAGLPGQGPGGAKISAALFLG